MHKSLMILILALTAGNATWAEENAATSAEERTRLVSEKLKAADFPYKGVRVDSTGACILDLSESSVTDLTSLRGLPVDVICLRWSKKISDLTPLAGMKLISLDLRDTPVSDLSPLASMPLQKLVIAGTKVKDIEAVDSMPLTFLDASGTEIQDLEPLKGSRLRLLILNQTQVTNLSPLKDLPLYSLHIEQTPVVDLRPLENMKLRELFFQPERITHGMSGIRNSKTLEFLGGGRQSDHFIEAKEFWDKFDHGHPVDNWLAEMRAGVGQYAPEPEILKIEPEREKRAPKVVGSAW